MTLSEAQPPPSKTTSHKSTARPGPQSNWETTEAGSSSAKELHPNLYRDGGTGIRGGPSIGGWDVYFSVLWNVLASIADTWRFPQIGHETYEKVFSNNNLDNRI